MSATKQAIQKLATMGSLPASLQSMLEAALREDEQHQGEPVALPMRRSWGCKDQAEIKAWNACLDEIAKLGPLYTRPAQGEPVWYMTENGQSAMTAKLKSVGEKNGWDTSDHRIPLYTHADPAEVERLREELDLIRASFDTNFNAAQEARAERDTLRARLAECEKDRKRLRDNNVERIDEVASYQRKLAELRTVLTDIRKSCELSHLRDAKIDAALSASAEPSAAKHETCKACHGEGVIHAGIEESPTTLCKRCDGSGNEPSALVERDGRADFDAWCVKHGRVVGYCGWREDFVIWQARAAMGRKR